MIRVKTCFVAEGISIDRDTGQVSAYSLVEHLESAGFPVVVQKLAFFTLWERALSDPVRNRAEFALTLEGRDILRQPVEIDFGSGLRSRCTVRVESFALDRPGRVVFQLAIPNQETAEWTFAADLRSATHAAAAQNPAAAAPKWSSDPVSILVVPPSDKKH